MPEKAAASSTRVPIELSTQALINLVYPLLLALAMIAPFHPPVLPGIIILTVVLVGLKDSVDVLRQVRQSRLTIQVLLLPVIVPIACFGLLVVGAALLIARKDASLYVVAAGSAALLVSGTRTTWSVLHYGRDLGRHQRL